MIRLSRITDYGIVLMVRLAQSPDDEARNARNLAAETDLPAPVVSKVLKTLAREGLLSSQRGSKGGYSLARNAVDISVPEMITALEGPISLTECSAHPGTCSQESSCDVREPWQRINAAVHDALSKITLADLAMPDVAGSIVPLRALRINLTSTGLE
ncbi:MAG: SUF system Fe-S cluster assembly regulator [Deltaproteobacteria bacterium]|nr:SUF system Fe-S cluster assembly regulator [Deltaproteobacteria bacterium]